MYLVNKFLQKMFTSASINIICLFVLPPSFLPSLFLEDWLTTWNFMKRTKILWILVVGYCILCMYVRPKLTVNIINVLTKHFEIQNIWMGPLNRKDFDFGFD